MALSLGGGIAAIAGAVQEPPYLTVRGLTVLGPNGKARITLNVGNDGQAAVEVFDAGGDSHVSLQTDFQGGTSALKMRDIKDIVRVDLGISGQGNAAGLLIDGQAH